MIIGKEHEGAVVWGIGTGNNASINKGPIPLLKNFYPIVYLKI
jgi:hypothetical protein